MRAIALAALILALVPAAALAQPAARGAPVPQDGSRLPDIPRGTPYPEVRARMLAAGFEAPRVLKRADGFYVPCGPYGAFDQCTKWPEILWCSVSGACVFAFRGALGRWAIVDTFGDNDLQMCWCFVDIHWAEPNELEGYVFSARPSGPTSRPAP